jgi:tRNA (guanine-N7-)-methyltransferase
MRPSDFKVPSKRLSGQHVIGDRIIHLAKLKHCQSSIIAEAKNCFIFPSWEHSDLFGNQKPVHVEYCSGNGLWIAERALSNPHINWVAVEMRLDRTRKIWSKIKNFQIDNLIVVNGEGEFATQAYFPKNSVSAIYINFPDPWPKRCHAKNRIVKTSFLNAIAEILKENGEITVVTDDPIFSEWTLQTFNISPQFSSLIAAPHYKTEWPHYGDSFFDALWREKGCTIRYHHFLKNVVARG